MEPIQYLDLADFLLIAEAVLSIDAEVLAKTADLGLADSALNSPAASFGGVEFYPDFATKVAVLCSHLAKNHPLPDGNKRVAYLCAVEFAERNGYEWQSPSADDTDGDETVAVILAVAAGTSSEEALIRWMADRLGVDPPGPQ